MATLDGKLAEACLRGEGQDEGVFGTNQPDLVLSVGEAASVCLRASGKTFVKVWVLGMAYTKLYAA